MIKISNIKLNIDHSESELLSAICRKLNLCERDIINYEIARKSIDARKKEQIKYIYSIYANINKEKKYMLKNKSNDIVLFDKIIYKEPEISQKKINNLSKKKIIITGSGPAGLFCSLKLAEAGLKPLLIERGYCIEERIEEVNNFWRTGKLNPNCNVQFGEGGAGTFSDGKLNTMVHDTSGRIGEVFRVFIEHGAPESIMYINKPHIGTDKLTHIVKSIRERIVNLGGEVRFNTCLTDIDILNKRVLSVTLNESEKMDCDILVLATGHSARDTFSMLNRKNVYMEKKAFAVGVRVEHRQELINQSQYGDLRSKLPPADYKLTYNCRESNRGVYSFCMCPGGYVVNASSEENMLAVNGMSNSDRGGIKANSAIVVTVNPEDFTGDTVLSGMEFQRELEIKAYKAGMGRIPVQRFGDFRRNSLNLIKTEQDNKTSRLMPDTKGEYSFCDVRGILPDFVGDSIEEGMIDFNNKISGFASDDTLMLGVETRTSSPVRIIRDLSFQSPDIKGLFPCGEGAGYAGGITSAAIDGIKVFEAIVSEA